jgi:hypothetical protein
MAVHNVSLVIAAWRFVQDATNDTLARIPELSERPAATMDTSALVASQLSRQSNNCCAPPRLHFGKIYADRRRFKHAIRAESPVTDSIPREKHAESKGKHSVRLIIPDHPWLKLAQVKKHYSNNNHQI